MNKLQIGDTIRFLNAVGGGKVKGFLNKQVAIIEDEYGFDIPVLISECVVIESAKEEKLEVEEVAEIAPTTETGIEVRDEVEETPEGEKITTCLAYLPIDKKIFRPPPMNATLSTTAITICFSLTSVAMIMPNGKPDTRE